MIIEVFGGILAKRAAGARAIELHATQKKLIELAKPFQIYRVCIFARMSAIRKNEPLGIHFHFDSRGSDRVGCAY